MRRALRLGLLLVPAVVVGLASPALACGSGDPRFVRVRVTTDGPNPVVSFTEVNVGIQTIAYQAESFGIGVYACVGPDGALVSKSREAVPYGAANWTVAARNRVSATQKLTLVEQVHRCADGSTPRIARIAWDYLTLKEFTHHDPQHPGEWLSVDPKGPWITTCLLPEVAGACD